MIPSWQADVRGEKKVNLAWSHAIIPNTNEARKE